MSKTKSNLNELCQKSGWASPKYTCVKSGPDHSPLFQGSVEVNGSSFHSSALFRTSNAAKNDVAGIAFSHYSTFSLPVAEMKKLKKTKLTPMSSCSSKGKGKEAAMKITPPDLAVPTEPDLNKFSGEETSMKITPPDLTVPTEPDLNKSVESHLLCNKVRVYTSIPDEVLPKGSVVLPIDEGKWTIVSLE